MTKVGLIFDQKTPDEWGIEFAAKRRGVEVVPLWFRLIAVDLARENLTEKLQGTDALLNRCESKEARLYASKIFEDLDYRVINPFSVEHICSSKLLTINLLARRGITTPKTIYVPWNASVSRAKSGRGGLAKDIADLIDAEMPEYPKIIKPDKGSWGRSIVRVRDRKELERAAERTKRTILNPLGVLAQEFLPKAFDLRINVAKKRNHRPFYVTCIARVSLTDQKYRTNTALGGLAVGIELNEQLKKTATDVAEIVGGQEQEYVLGIDMMPRMDKPSRDEVYRLAGETNLYFDMVRKAKVRRRDDTFATWLKRLDAAYKAYTESPEYRKLKTVIESTLPRAKWTTHEVNSCPDFWTNTRNVTGCDLAEIYMDISTAN